MRRALALLLAASGAAADTAVPAPTDGACKPGTVDPVAGEKPPADPAARRFWEAGRRCFLESHRRDPAGPLPARATVWLRRGGGHGKVEAVRFDGYWPRQPRPDEALARCLADEAVKAAPASSSSEEQLLALKTARPPGLLCTPQPKLEVWVGEAHRAVAPPPLVAPTVTDVKVRWMTGDAPAGFAEALGRSFAGFDAKRCRWVSHVPLAIDRDYALLVDFAAGEVHFRDEAWIPGAWFFLGEREEGVYQGMMCAMEAVRAAVKGLPPPRSGLALVGVRVNWRGRGD